MAIPTLDTSAGFTNGDEVRLVDALDLGMSESTLSGVVTCMNQLTGFSPASVTKAVAYLDRYDAASTAKTAADLANTESKTLIKADVLEWAKNGGQLVGLDAEMAECVSGLMNLFAFCPYVNVGNTGSGVTQLLRS